MEEYGQTRDWLQLQMDRLDVCAEPSPNKHAIQNKLDRLQVCLVPLFDYGMEVKGPKILMNIEVMNTYEK